MPASFAFTVARWLPKLTRSTRLPAGIVPGHYFSVPQKDVEAALVVELALSNWLGAFRWERATSSSPPWGATKIAVSILYFTGVPIQHSNSLRICG